MSAAVSVRRRMSIEEVGPLVHHLAKALHRLEVAVGVDCSGFRTSEAVEVYLLGANRGGMARAVRAAVEFLKDPETLAPWTMRLPASRAPLGFDAMVMGLSTAEVLGHIEALIPTTDLAETQP